MTRRSRWENPAILLAPAVAFLMVGFLIPLVWFFFSALREIGSIGEIADHFATTLTSKAVLTALFTTNWIALLVTLVVLLAGYPIAYFLIVNRSLQFTLVIFCIVVPYFTSVIVRTYSWMALLGRNGVINRALREIGLIEAPLPLLYNKAAIVVGMSYVLLPYMVLTLYASMRSIDPALVRAAHSLGASRVYAFSRVFLPLSMHGVLSACLIVFILAIGFFVTPALMGGPADVMIAMLIERAAEITLDWRLAAIMSLFLLIVTLVLYAIYFRVADVRRLMGEAAR